MPSIKPQIRALRQKSEVHRSIIDTHGRRKKTKTKWVSKIIKSKNEDWGKNGEVINNKKLIISDLNRTNKNPSIMILGPGEGAEAVLIASKLKRINPNNSNIDTLGLGNQLTAKAEAVIRTDYSTGLDKIKSKDLFEHFNHLKFVKKYDYIYSAYGPILHTKFPEIAILKTASMLRPGGFARIVPWFSNHEFYDKKISNIVDYLKSTGNESALEFKIEDNSLIIKRIK